MKIKNFLRLVSLLLVAVAFTACSEKETTGKTDLELAREKFAALEPTHLIVNQGNQASGIEGTVTALNYSTGAAMSNAFAAVNGFALGDTPQNIFSTGKRSYICVFGSNLVWAVDAQNLQVMGMMKVSSPQRVIADAKWVYVASNDGFVTRFNAQTFAEDKYIEVGPNPMGLALANGDLYVSISDSYNWAGGMANGKRVARIDISEWKVEAEIHVGLNPTRLEATSDGCVFCVCNGNFDSEQYIYRIKADNSAEQICNGSDCVASGSKVFVAYGVTDWITYTSTCTLSLYDSMTSSIASSSLTPQPLDYSPIFIAFDSGRDMLILGKRASGSDYTAAGSVEFYSTDGSLQKSIPAGVEPYSVAVL